MSYTITNTRGQVITIIANEVADTTTTLTLLGRNFAGYGQIIADDLIQLLENSASDTAYPPSPLQGELCYRVDSRTLFLWNGTNWQMVGMAGGDTFPGLVYFDGGFIVRNVLAPSNCKMRRIRIDNGGSFLIEGLNDDYSVKVIPLTITCDGFMHAAATPAPSDDSTTLATTAFVQIKVRMLQTEIDNLQTQITALTNALNADVAALQAVDTSLQNQITNLYNWAVNAIAHAVPYGVVVMWTGAVADIPAGYHLCDGSYVPGQWWTPDLRDRFVIGAGGSYYVHQTGGATTGGGQTSEAGVNYGETTGYYGTTPAGTHGHAIYEAPDHSHGVQGHQLTINEIPNHDHNLRGGDRQVVFLTAAWSNQFAWGGPYTVDQHYADSNGGDWSHSHGLDPGGRHNHTLDGVGDHTHSVNIHTTHHHTFSGVSVMPPYWALCYICKIT